MEKTAVGLQHINPEHDFITCMERDNIVIVLYRQTLSWTTDGGWKEQVPVQKWQRAVCFADIIRATA